MGKPLSRPDCLRQSPACLGKGEDEDGYIEDCYVPQRSIYDTMRINEQIDQGAKLSQPPKSTLEKGDGSTISSNGTVGAPAAFEAKAPESKKLDERVIFDALKLSSDVSKSAPAPARRRPNAEKKENINRRSWKSFMPPNFPEFAERIEASLSEVSEAGTSNPSLQDKQGSATVLADGSRQPDRGESASEPLTLEHVPPKPPGAPEAQEPKPSSEAFVGRFFQDECRPLLEPEDVEVDLAGGKRRDHQLPSATWPRAVKNTIRVGLGAGRHDTLEADDSDCVIEMVPLSPCLSEELLDPGVTVLVTPGLREKTESELRFEEDERLIMMEAEEEQAVVSESGKAAEKKNNNSGLMDISEEREPLSVLPMVALGAVETSPDVQEISSHASRWQELWDDSQLQAVSSAPVPQETHGDLTAAALTEEEEEEEDSACNAEAGTAQLEEEESAPGSGTSASPLVAEQCSDTDSVQMFLELEKLCMNEEEADGAAPVAPEAQGIGLGSESLDAEKDLEWLSENSAEASQLLAHLEVSAADSAVVSDLEDFDATHDSQVASTTEPTVSESYSERDTSGDLENVMFPSPPVVKDAVSQQSLSSLVSQVEEYGADLWTAHELAKTYPVEGLLDFAVGDVVASVGATCCHGTFPCAHVSTAGGEGETEEEISALTGCGEERTSPNHDELATTPEELDSLAKEMVDLGGKELPLFEPNSSERTDVSNWDVPELVSEDEVAGLDKESVLDKGQVDETEGTDGPWVPPQSDVVLEEDSGGLAKHSGPSGDLKAKRASSSCQLEPLPGTVYEGEVVMGAVVFQEETPEMVGQTAAEGDILEDGDLEWLWGHGGNSEAPGDGEAGGGFVGANSLSLALVECCSATQPGVEDFASAIGGEAGIVSSLASKEAPGSLPESTGELAGVAGGPSTIAGPAATEELVSSPLTILDALPPSVGDSVLEATSNEEGCGRGGLLPAGPWVHRGPESVPARPGLEEASLASIPFCVGDGPAQPPSRAEQAKATISSSWEEHIHLTQEVGEGRATLLPLPAETPGAAVVPPAREEGGRCLLPLAPGALQEAGHSTPQPPAPTAPERLTTAAPDAEGPSASSPAAAEGPPGGTDGSVPDNEVFVSPGSPHAATQDLKPPPGGLGGSEDLSPSGLGSAAPGA